MTEPSDSNLVWIACQYLASSENSGCEISFLFLYWALLSKFSFLRSLQVISSVSRAPKYPLNVPPNDYLSFSISPGRVWLPFRHFLLFFWETKYHFGFQNMARTHLAQPQSTRCCLSRWIYNSTEGSSCLSELSLHAVLRYGESYWVCWDWDCITLN